MSKKKKNYPKKHKIWMIRLFNFQRLQRPGRNK